MYKCSPYLHLIYKDGKVIKNRSQIGPWMRRRSRFINLITLWLFLSLIFRSKNRWGIISSTGAQWSQKPARYAPRSVQTPYSTHSDKPETFGAAHPRCLSKRSRRAGKSRDEGPITPQIRCTNVLKSSLKSYLKSLKSYLKSSKFDLKSLKSNPKLLKSS